MYTVNLPTRQGDASRGNPCFFFEAGLGSLNSKGGRIWLFFGGGGS